MDNLINQAHRQECNICSKNIPPHNPRAPLGAQHTGVFRSYGADSRWLGCLFYKYVTPTG